MTSSLPVTITHSERFSTLSTFGYSKMSQNAISAMSFLAERFGHPTALVSSAQVAEARNIPQAIAAKVLTQLSQADLVTGAPGPRGGYRLARDPSGISFYDVIGHFDPIEDAFPCPFGIDYCPSNNPCPVHDEIVAMRESLEAFLKNTHFGSFQPG